MTTSTIGIIDALNYEATRVLFLLGSVAAVAVGFKLVAAIIRGSIVALLAAIMAGGLATWAIVGGGLSFVSDLTEEESEKIANRDRSTGGVSITLPSGN